MQWHFAPARMLLMGAFCLWFAMVAGAATTTGTALVRHVPAVNSNGTVEGSIQQMLGEGLSLNSGAVITNNLLVPGTPNVQINGQPNFGGVTVGIGSTSPSGYYISLNSGARLGKLLTRTAPLTLPAVAAPPLPAGSRNVTINSAGQSAGTWSTLRDLTLNSNVGQYAVPPGTYGTFTGNSGTGFILGVAGATEAAVYNFQRFNFNGPCQIAVVGPVIINLAYGFSSNAQVGSSSNPDWLNVRIASGGLNLNSGCVMYGYVNAPAGDVMVNGQLSGGVICDRLTVNSGGILRLWEMTSSGNQPPTASNSTVTLNEDAATPVTLIGQDPDNGTLTYSIVTQPQHGVLSGTGAQRTYTPAPDYHGADSFTFTVSDGAAVSNTATVSLNITAINDAPQGQAQTVALSEDTTTAITLAGSDVEGAALTYSIVASPAHGTLSGSGAQRTYTPAANYNGPDSFSFKINDGQLDSAPTLVSINITPVPDHPVASAFALPVVEDQPAQVTLSGVDTDGQPLTFAIVTQPAHGTLTGTGAALLYTPNADYNGPDSFTYTAGNGTLTSAPAQVSIGVTSFNDAPVATPATLVTNEDGALSIVLSGSDVDGDALTYTVLTQPLHGTLSGGGASWTYQPASNYHNTPGTPDGFTFKVSDGVADSAPATVSIVVNSVNDQPTILAQTLAAVEDTASALRLAATDTDGDALAYTVVIPPGHGSLSGVAPALVYTPEPDYSGPDAFSVKVNDGNIDSAVAVIEIHVEPRNDAPVAIARATLTTEETPLSITLSGTDVDQDELAYTIVDEPRHGTLTGSAPHLVYTPGANYSGSDSFSFTAQDAALKSAPAFVDITVLEVNDAPTADDKQLVTPEDNATAIALSANDVEGDALTFSIVVPPAHGTLSGTGQNLLYTPAPNYFGPDTFTYKASDLWAGSAPARVDIQVTSVNDAPSVGFTTPSSGALFLLGASVPFNVAATDIDGTIASIALYEGDTQIAQATGPSIAFAWPAAGPGSHTFVARATDNEGTLTVSDPVSIVVNASPQVAVIEPLDGARVEPGSVVLLKASASDTDGTIGKVEFFVDNLKVGESGTAPFGVSWTTPGSGTHTITAHAIDDRGALSVSSGVSVQINTPPVVVLTSPVDQARFPAGATIPLAATATDASGTIVRVEFFDGAAKIGEATAAPFELAWSNASGGVHSLTALATNSLNASATSAPVSITVNSAPQVSAGPDQDVILPAAATLSGTVNDDGLPEGTPLSLTWSRVSGPGAVTFGSSNAAVSTAAFSAPGVYLLRLTAGDGELSASDDIAVTVRFANRTPVTQDKSIQTPEDQPANVVLTATDADGDPLTFTVLTPPLHGTLDGTGAALLYKPAANYHGADQFFYKASDGRVDSAAAKVSIVVTSVNDAPVPHSPSLEVLLGQALPVTLSATDADGDALQFVVISQPTHGTLSGTAPDLVYTSRPDSPGHDQFLFTVSDGIAGAVQGQVSIDVRLSDTSPRSRTYTSRIDFEEGQLGQVVADPAGFLETKATQSDFDFVWIPVFTKNTVVRLDTETGRALGEYRTTPEGIGSAYASRTAIDVRGNVWIANERDNSVVMIANPDGPDWVDRNHNGRLDTSTGLGDVKPWGNGNGTDHNGGTTTAADELIVRYIRTAIKEPRHLSIDNNNNLWVGGGTVPDFDLISAISGEVLRHEPSIGRGGNGGFIDLHGVLWSTGSFLRWDTRRPLSTVPADSWNLEPAGWWATAKDSKGNLWVTRDPSTTVQKYNSQGALIGSFVHGDYWSQGIAIDQDDHVWIAHSHCGQSVGHLRPDGTFVGNVATAVHGPTGVSVDRKGRIWVSSTTGVVQRINPLAGEIGADGQTPVGEVDLTTPYLGGTLWTYANFTGNAASISGARGRWSFVYDSYLDDSAWDKAVWNADIYNDGSLTVTAAPTNNPIGIAEMRPLPIGTAPAGTGRYLLVNVDFDSGEDGLSPVLYDLTVGTLGYEVPVPLVDWNINAGKDFSATWPDALQIRAGVSRTAAMEGIVEPQLTWSQVSGPGVVGFDDAHKLRPKTQFSVPGVYTLRVTAVFNGQTKSDDVVISLSPRNKSPWASAGENRSIRSSADTLTLHGITRDDGLPSGAPFTSQWKKKFGPGVVTFSNPASAETTATFSVEGSYLLELTASDTDLQYSSVMEARVGRLSAEEPPTGLVSWWQANGNGADHISGNEAFLASGATYADGHVGASFRFDGQNDRALVFRNLTTNIAGNSGAFTVECWVNGPYVNGYGASKAFYDGTLVGWHNGTLPGVNLHFNQYSSTLVADIYDTAGQLHSLSTGMTSGWTHIALTYDRATGIASLYRAGTLVQQANLGSFTPQTGYDIYFGNSPLSPGFFAGQLDEVSLYNRALHGDEIYSIFAAGAVGKCPPGSNKAPSVDAGPDRSTTATPYQVELLGKVADDGSPTESTVHIEWTKVAGPGTVTFANLRSAQTTASFSAAGVYVLKLAADDTARFSSDLVEVRVHALSSSEQPPGLQAWWPGNGDAREVVHGKNGLLAGGTTFETGIVSTAFKFDGSNDYMRVPAAPQLDVGRDGAFTVEGWMSAPYVNFYTSLPGKYDATVVGWHSGTQPGVNLHCNQFTFQFIAELYDTTGQLHAFPPTTINPWGVWQHIAFSYDRATGDAKFYIDGILVRTSQLGSFTPQTGYDLYMGSSPRSLGFFAGLLDEISLYNRALRDDEIYAVFATAEKGKSPPVSNQAPVVDGGADKEIVGLATSLTGSVIDDSLPEGGNLSSQWSKVFGPGSVTFGNATGLSTTVGFSTPGNYVLSLTANDSLNMTRDLVEIRAGTASVSDPIPGLRAWWPGNGDATEVLGGKTAWTVGGVAFSEGKVSAAFSFDGQNDYIQVPSTSGTNIAGNGDFSVECWVNGPYVNGYGASTPFYDGTLVGWHNGTSPGVNIHFDQYSMALGVELHDTAGQAHSVPPTTLVDGWHHIAVTYQQASGVAKIYIDSVLVRLADVGSFIPQTGYDLYFGHTPKHAGHFRGSLDEVSLYDRVLQDNEIHHIFTLAASGKHMPGLHVAPRVDAGPDQSAPTVASAVDLLGQVVENNPLEGSTLTSEWSKVSGPGAVTFVNAAAPQTSVTFSAPGIYLLSLTARDGVATVSDVVTVRVGILYEREAASCLRAWWPGNSSTQELVSGNDGKLVGGTTFGEGTVSRAFQFDGSNDYIRVPAAPQLDVGHDGAFTVEGWMSAPYVNATTLRKYDATVVGWHSGTQPGVNLHCNQFTFQFIAELYDTAGQLHAFPATNINPGGVWQHIAFSYDRATGDAKFYINGILARTSQLGNFTPQTAHDLYMGSSPRSPGFFAGLLDEISLYSCALADSEILAIYRAGSIGKAPAGNHGPVVNAGPNRRLITAPYTITLPGQISDDGLPAGASMRSLWSKRAGPGNVTFADSSAPITTASFDQPGFYQLQLKADDSLVAARDLVDVLVDGGTSLPPPAGLRAWWPGNFSPVEIINGIDAVAAGNATYGEGKVGGGFLFDGTGDYFRAPAASSLDVGTANGFTVETWIQPDDLIGRPLVEWDVPGYGVHFWSSVSFSGSLLANVVDSTGAFHAVQSPGNLLSTSQFQHVALTYDKILGITRLWLNGQKVAEAASGVFTPRTNGPLLIGGRLQGSPASFKGRMDEVGIYDRALSQAELQSLYNTGASGKTPVVHNTAPVANAGPDRTVTLPVAAILNGSVQDDGEPNNATPTLLWSQTDGPATANFASNNVAVTSVTFTAPGTYHFLLSATDGELSSTDSVEVVVSPDPRTPPVVSLVSPGAGSIVPASVPLSISATASDTDDNIAQVEFFLDNISAGTDSTAPYEVTVPSIAVGTHTVRAVATDESGLSAVSADRTIVAELPGLPLVSLNSPVEGARFIAGLAIDLGAQAATTIGNITRVEFLRDGIKFAEDTSAPFTSNMGGLAAGSYELTARAIASTGLSQTSTPVHIQVVNDPGGSPRLVLLTPEEAATVTGPTLFTGTVTTPILKSWHLDYRRKGDKCLGWTPFASGTSEVTAGELGTLDTTLLRNGIYEIQLVAVDLRNRGYGTPISTLVVDGGMKVGQFSVAFNDLTVSLAGIPITVTRTYDSRDNCPGDFGRGWNLDFNSVKLTKNLKLGESWFYDVQVNYNSFSTFSVEDDGPHVITITFPDGKTYRFAPEAKFSGRYAGQGGQLGNDTTRIFPWSTSDPFAISFKPMPGTHGTLEARGMPAALYMLDDFGGEIVWQSTPDDPFNGVVFDDASGFVFTAQNGSRFEFDAQGKLVKMTERNGNTLTFSRDGIFHSNGLSILFTRDAQERITKLTDPNGKEITYAYSAGGDLFSVSDRGGEVTTHTYDAQHELTGIIDPRGIPAVRNEYDAAGRLVKTTDADGKTMLYSHNIAGRREIITDRLGRSTTHVYDLRGNVTSSTDPLGHTTSTTYDAHDNKLSETNALGQTTTYRYDARDQMLEMRDALGNVTSFVYDAYGSPLSVTDPKGNVTSMTYDNRGNLASTTDALGNSTTYSYDTAGNRTGETNALNQTTTYRFNGLGHMTGMTDALGHVTSYTYDANGNQLTSSTTRTRADGTVETLTSTNVYDDDGRVVSTIDPDGISSATVYNEIGKTSVVTDKLGRETSMTYDRQGRPIRTTYPDGAYEEIGYDFEGKQVSRTDRAGHVSTSEYDAAGRLVKSIAPDGSFTQSVCDAVGRVTSIIDALGHTTTYSYDTAGRRTAVTNALGKTSRYTYDVNGNQLTFTDALGRVTSHVYDALNRRVATVFPDNTSTATGYDALGRRISETDQNGISKAFAYDALGRLVSVTDALNQVTSYTYDELGNQLTQTDANQHTTRYEYDRLGRRTKRILPLGMSESIGYDALGNMTARSDFNGKTTTYTYDALNRLTSRKPDASFGEPTVSYTYTPTGQRATMKDRFGTSTYSYDERDRLVKKVGRFGTLNYTYNANGNVTSIRSLNVGGTNVTYGYDALNRLSTVNDAHLATAGYAYDDVGNLASFHTVNGVTHSYAYNSLNRLTSMAVSSMPLNGAPATIASYLYTLAPGGQRTSATDLTGRSASYQYDALYRLTRETIANDPAGKNGQIAYTHDPVGNRLSRTSTVAGLASQAFGYDANDRLLSDTYDANGNTRTGSVTLSATGAEAPPRTVNDTYDSGDHLLLRGGGGSAPGGVTNVYDGDGNRVCEIVNGQVVSFLLDTLNPTGYAQVLEEVTGPTNVVLRTYCYGHDLLAQDTKDGSGNWSATWYGYDGHGSVRLLTSELGEVVDTYNYEAFGTLLTGTGTTSNRYLYCGEQYSAALGLYSLRARFMNAANGRFWNADTYEGGDEDPTSLHKYLYCGADPVNGIDPSGNLTLSEVGSVVSTVSLISSIANFSVERTWGNAGMVAIDVALFPLGIAKALVKSGLTMLTIRNAARATKSLQSLEPSAEAAAKWLFDERFIQAVFRDADLTTFFTKLGVGKKVVDLVARGENGGLLLVEAKSGLGTKELQHSLDKFMDTVSAFKQIVGQSGGVWHGIDELIITCNRLKGLNGYTVDAAGHLYQAGIPYMIEGVQVVVKTIKF